MHWRWALLLVAGCDGVFGLTHLRDPADANGDGSPTDAIDAPTCTPQTLHDEDSDNIHDDCDACPTIVSTTADTDKDGLTDACDPNLSDSIDGDRILLASMFASSTELSTTYDTTGTASAFVSNDALQLPAGSVVATKQPVIPTMIVATLDSLTGAGAGSFGDQFQVGANGGTCSISVTGCANEPNQICVQFAQAMTLNIPIAEVRSVAVSMDAAGLHCDIATATVGNARINTPGALTNSDPFMKATGTAVVRVSNFVVYGEK